jgi:hypothetical protein
METAEKIRSRKIVPDNHLSYVLNLNKECMALRMKHVKLRKISPIGVIHLLFSITTNEKVVVEVGENIFSSHSGKDQDIYVPAFGCFYLMEEIEYYKTHIHMGGGTIALIAGYFRIPKFDFCKMLREHAPLQPCKGA